MISCMDAQKRDLRLFFRLNEFYGLLFAVGWLAYALIPDISSHCCKA